MVESQQKRLKELGEQGLVNIASEANRMHMRRMVERAGWGDGTCRHCQIGDTHICPNVRWPGFGPVGGFAEFIPSPLAI